MKQLRPYQERGYSDIFREWTVNDVLFFCLTTGGGKTVIFVEVIKEMLSKGMRVMLIAHREELIYQGWRTLLQARILAGVIQADISTYEDDGKRYIVNNPKLPCQVCSIQTIARRNQLPHADVIIVDEAHHVEAKNSYGKIFARFPFAKILMVSATPYRLSGEGFLNVAPGRVTKLIVNSTLKTLIADGWLVPLRYFIASLPDLSNAGLSKGDYSEEGAKKAMELAPIVESYLKHAKGLQGVCFAVNVAHSVEIAGQYWREGVPCEHLDANTPAHVRKQIISDYKCGLVKVVTNVGIFTEGTDFPNCQFVQLARPTKSLSMFLQMVGRGTRTLPGIVDGLQTASERTDAIAASAKPHCIILDNGGLYEDHGFPDENHNWEMYFNGGWKKAKEKKEVTDDMEILVYVAEDGEGNRFKTTKLKEIEGMELIEVTHEIRRKAINVKSIKEFDRLYAIFTRKNLKKPGYTSVKKFIDYCDKMQLLMVPEIWDYLNRKLCLEVKKRVADVEHNRQKFPGMYPENQFQQVVENIKASGVSSTWLNDQRRAYDEKNKKLIEDYLMSKLTTIVGEPTLL